MIVLIKLACNFCSVKYPDRILPPQIHSHYAFKTKWSQPMCNIPFFFFSSTINNTLLGFLWTRPSMRNFAPKPPTIINHFSSNSCLSKKKLNSRATKKKKRSMKNKNKAKKRPFDILWYSLQAKIMLAFRGKILHFQSSKKIIDIIFKPLCRSVMLKCIATSSACQTGAHIWLRYMCVKPQPAQTQLLHTDTDRVHDVPKS